MIPHSDPVARARAWVRASCWIGAITDVGAAIQMLFPDIFIFAYRPRAFAPSLELGYAMGMGASLMLGWTVLLLWAAQRPIERRGILVITVVPVIAGLAINEMVGIANGLLPVGPLVPVFFLQGGLTGLFLFSYVLASAPTVARSPD